jgi:hypothetical protein
MQVSRVIAQPIKTGIQRCPFYLAVFCYFQLYAAPKWRTLETVATLPAYGVQFTSGCRAEAGEMVEHAGRVEPPPLLVPPLIPTLPVPAVVP